jgi:hypothetical protein
VAHDSLTELQALARHDADLRGETERLRELDAAVALLRARAEALGAFLDELPARRGRLETELADAREDVGRRRGELARAEDDLARASDEADRVAATRARERAADHVAVALAATDRAAAALADLEGEEAATPQELAALCGEAGRLGGALPDVPAPAAEPAALVDWASRAHASIFVAAGTLDAQRDRLVREASELGSLLLGEPTYGSTVEQVAARVEAALRE